MKRTTKIGEKNEMEVAQRATQNIHKNKTGQEMQKVDKETSEENKRKTEEKNQKPAKNVCKVPRKLAQNVRKNRSARDTPESSVTSGRPIVVR